MVDPNYSFFSLFLHIYTQQTNSAPTEEDTCRYLLPMMADGKIGDTETASYELKEQIWKPPLHTNEDHTIA